MGFQILAGFLATLFFLVSFVAFIFGSFNIGLPSVFLGEVFLFYAIGGTELIKGKKSSKKLLKWGLNASTIIVIIYLVYTIIPKWECKIPNADAQSEIRNLRTVLEAHYADFQKYPQPDKVTSHPFVDDFYDDVTVFYIVTSRDEQHYFSMAFHTKGGSRLYVDYDDSPTVWWIPVPEVGLVTARPL